MQKDKIRRGDIFYAKLSPVVGSEQGGLRPVVVVQNDVGNQYSPTLVVAAITSKISKPQLPTHVAIEKKSAKVSTGLVKDSVALLEQLRTIDKQRLQKKIGYLTPKEISALNQALAISVGLVEKR